jgi:hypothetical protein
MVTQRLSLFKACIFIFLFAQLGYTIPAYAQGGQQQIHVRVYVGNSRNGSAVPSARVYFEEQRTVPCPTGAGGSAETGPDGVADIYVTACAAIAEIWVSRMQNFPGGGAGFVHIVSGQSFYQWRLSMTPENAPAVEERTLHIRVRGRDANGNLVPVHFATVYDEQGTHVATTDYNGMATAHTRDAMGETVRMRADGGSKWGESTSSFIVGASEGGTTLTRADDYINFVMKGTGEENAEDVELSITVVGQGSSGRVPVHNASVYDGEGRHLVTTGYDGKASVRIKVPANGEPYTIKVDAGSRWKPASKEIFGGPRGSNGTVPFNLTGARAVTVVLEPGTAAKELTVEVLNHDTDKPVPSATVTLYKPNHFPGTAVAHAETDSEGLATFSSDQVDEAMLNGSAHVGATHGGSKSSVQTLSNQLLEGESPKYLLYLTETEVKTKWSGIWYQGPYTIQVSGGNGSLSFTALRESDLGTCCPTIDQGSGSCTVKGNVATCTAQGHFHNSASDIWHTDHTILTYEGDYVDVKAHVVSSREKTDQYHPCPTSGPEMSKCTSLYEGNTLTGTWTRQKP